MIILVVPSVPNRKLGAPTYVTTVTGTNEAEKQKFGPIFALKNKKSSSKEGMTDFRDYFISKGGESIANVLVNIKDGVLTSNKGVTVADSLVALKKEVEKLTDAIKKRGREEEEKEARKKKVVYIINGTQVAGPPEGKFHKAFQDREGSKEIGDLPHAEQQASVLTWMINHGGEIISTTNRSWVVMMKE